jgi:hypothetical protein
MNVHVVDCRGLNASPQDSSMPQTLCGCEHIWKGALPEVVRS